MSAQRTSRGYRKIEKEVTCVFNDWLIFDLKKNSPFSRAPALYYFANVVYPVYFRYVTRCGIA